MNINDPVVLKQLQLCHEMYEKALIDNDAETLNSLFWNSPHAIRFGVTENLHGADEIRTFRKGRAKINLGRDIERLDIMAFGDSAGIVNLEFMRPTDGVERHGRQTQFWFRFEEGWRIVSAHVSLLPGPPSYLDAAAERIGLPIDPSNRKEVNEQLNRIGALAEFLMQFPLGQDVEAAGVFEA